MRALRYEVMIAINGSLSYWMQRPPNSNPYRMS